MPYIDKSIREKYDEPINKIVSTLENKDCNETAGILAYIIYKLCIGVGKRFGHTDFARLNMIVGVFDNVKDEFKRRILWPYEDTKREVNGDV